jgi:hypothetical protein
MIDSVLQRYSMPDWTRPYIYKYVRGNPSNAIRRAMSFIDVKRRKGEVTDKYVRLPNGLTFKMGSVVHILSLFYYCESRISDIRLEWAEGSRGSDLLDYKEYFKNMADLNAARMRAIKNLIEGLNYKVGSPSRELVDVLESVRSISNPYERVIALNVILRDTYARPFGFVFYRIFYPVANEFMRSFGKAFTDLKQENRWGIDESRRIISDGLLSSESAISLAERILSMTCRSINAELHLAKEAKVLEEAKLLRDISIAYPLQDLRSMGVELDVSAEARKIIRLSNSASISRCKNP